MSSNERGAWHFHIYTGQETSENASLVVFNELIYLFFASVGNPVLNYVTRPVETDFTPTYWMSVDQVVDAVIAQNFKFTPDY